MAVRGPQWGRGSDAQGGASQSRGCLARSTVVTGPQRTLAKTRVAALQRAAGVGPKVDFST